MWFNNVIQVLRCYNWQGRNQNDWRLCTDVGQHSYCESDIVQYWLVFIMQGNKVALILPMGHSAVAGPNTMRKYGR